VSGIKGADSTTDLLTTQCGTPTYIAPEIISHAGAGYSGEKVDCWALGVILFFMLTGGKLPFDNDRLEVLFDQIQTSPVQYPERISADAVDLLDKLLAKSPAKRPTAKQIRNHHWCRARSGRRKRRPGERRGSSRTSSTLAAPTGGALPTSVTAPVPSGPPPPPPTLRLSFAEKKETEEAIGQLQLLIARSSRYLPAALSAENTAGTAAVGSAALAAAPAGAPSAVGADYLDSLFDDDDGDPPPATPMQLQLQAGATPEALAAAPDLAGAARRPAGGLPSSQFQSLLRLCGPSPTSEEPQSALPDRMAEMGSAATPAAGPVGTRPPPDDHLRAAPAVSQPPLRRVATQRALARVRASMFSLTADEPPGAQVVTAAKVAPSQPLVRGAPAATAEVVVAARQALDAWEKAMRGGAVDPSSAGLPVSDEQLGALKQLLDLWKLPTTPSGEPSPVERGGEGHQRHPSDSSASPSASSPSSVCTTNTTPADSLPGYSPPVVQSDHSVEATPQFDHKELNEEWGHVLNATHPGPPQLRGLSDRARPPDRGPSHFGGADLSDSTQATLYRTGVRVTEVDDAALDAPDAGGSGAPPADVVGLTRPALPRTSSSVAALAAAERVTAAERIAKQVREQERALASLALSDDDITEVGPDKGGEELSDEDVSAISLSLPGVGTLPPPTPHSARRVGDAALPDRGDQVPVIVTTSSVFFRGDALTPPSTTRPSGGRMGGGRPGAAGGRAVGASGGRTGTAPTTVAPPARLSVTKSVVRDPARFDDDTEPARSVALGGLSAGLPPANELTSAASADAVVSPLRRGRRVRRGDSGEVDNGAHVAAPAHAARETVSSDAVLVGRQRPSAAGTPLRMPESSGSTGADADGGFALSSFLPSRGVRHPDNQDSSFSWGRLVGSSSRDAVAAPTALAVKGLKRLGFAPKAAADTGSGAAPATAPPVAVAVGNNSGLVFESAMSRDRCMAAVGRLLVDDLYCDVLSRTDGGHAKLRCTLPNQKKDWPIKIYFESIDSHDPDAGAGVSSGGWRGKSASPRLARTVVVLSKGRNSELTPAQLWGFYDQLLIKFRQSSSDAVVSPPPHKVWR